VPSLTTEQRRSIDLAKEQLVSAAETLLKEAEVTPSKDFGHSQLRNLVAVAAETESPAVVLNFIRYQMGRDDKGKNWARGTAGKRIGDRFISALNDGEGVVSLTLKTVVGDEGEALAKQLVKMELIRYFLGFATRYMKYLELQNRPAQRAGGQ
jgi:hypothetical protein